MKAASRSELAGSTEGAQSSEWNHAADYELAWRWLIRDLPGIVRPIGWSPEERQLLFREDASAEIDGTSPVIWVVNADAADPCHRDLCDLTARDSRVVLVGQGSTVRRWERAVLSLWGEVVDRAEYALIPPHRPRLAISLESRESAAAGLRFHTPGAFASKLALVALRCANAAGFKYPLRAREVLLLGGNSVAASWRGSRRTTLALYFGVQGCRRKTVALVKTPGAYVVAKSGASAEARELLRGEADTLEMLKNTSIGSNVPRIVSRDESVASTTIELEFRPRVRVNADLELKTMFEFLGKLAENNRMAHPLDQFVAGRVATSFPRWSPELRPRVMRLARQVVEWGKCPIWTAFSHGDFARWNTAVTPQGFFVFDWEDFNPEGVQFADLFRWVSADMLLLSRNPDAGKTAKRVLWIARQLAGNARFGGCVRTQFIVWCLLQMDAYRPEFYLTAAEVALKSQRHQP